MERDSDFVQIEKLYPGQAFTSLSDPSARVDVLEVSRVINGVRQYARLPRGALSISVSDLYVIPEELERLVEAPPGNS